MINNFRFLTIKEYTSEILIGNSFILPPVLEIIKGCFVIRFNYYILSSIILYYK